MKRKRGRYYVGDRVMDRAWHKEGTVKEVPTTWTSVSRLTVEWDDGHTSETWVPAVMLTFKFAESLVKQMNPKYFMPKKGDRVKIPSIGIKGTVNFVDQNSIFVNHYFPIQVILDEPYDESGHKLYRTNLKDIKELKKKDKEKKVKKKKAPTPPPVEEDDLMWDDDESAEEWD